VVQRTRDNHAAAEIYTRFGQFPTGFRWGVWPRAIAFGAIELILDFGWRILD
jgi:hypothetical protein